MSCSHCSGARQCGGQILLASKIGSQHSMPLHPTGQSWKMQISLPPLWMDNLKQKSLSIRGNPAAICGWHAACCWPKSLMAFCCRRGAGNEQNPSSLFWTFVPSYQRGTLGTGKQTRIDWSKAVPKRCNYVRVYAIRPEEAEVKVTA